MTARFSSQMQSAFSCRACAAGCTSARFAAMTDTAGLRAVSVCMIILRILLGS